MENKEELCMMTETTNILDGITGKDSTLVAVCENCGELKENCKCK